VKIDLLDHGFVRLVDHMGSDLSVVRSARVSYNAEPRNDGSDAKLIHYLWRNRHTSPFEVVKFTWEVKAPIFILRQWDRHRMMDDPTQLEGFPGLAYQKFWSYNEVSARYTELPEEFYVPRPGLIGVQSKSNKQVRDIDAVMQDSAEQKQFSYDIHNACTWRPPPQHLHALLRDDGPAQPLPLSSSASSSSRAI
jgi:thymidylate synthase (FAD)